MNAETKIHLFIGPANSGKTRLAKEICNPSPDECYDINGRNLLRLLEDPWLFENASPETKIILIDDVLSFARLVPMLMIWSIKIDAHVKHSSSFTIKPKMILVTICGDIDSIESAVYKDLPECFVIHKFPLSYLDAANLKEELIANLKTNE